MTEAREEDGALFDPTMLTRERLAEMAEAGAEILECYRVLAKTGDNIVGEILRGQGGFVELNHYPDGDVYDSDSGAQYYYHAHRDGEHGHFHTFLRQKGMPAGMAPIAQSDADYMHQRDDSLSHLIAISMDSYGFPISLFTTNRWVAADNWYACDDVVRMLDRFEIDHARPSWPVNRWITAMIKLFRPQIAALLRQRDDGLARWQAAHPARDAFEDRELEVISELPVSVEDQIRRVDAARRTSAGGEPPA